MWDDRSAIKVVKRIVFNRIISIWYRRTYISHIVEFIW